MNASIAQLRAFVAVVDEGSFSAAADVLGISQPAISSALRSLETQLGEPVLDRTAMTPTELGELILPRARRIGREHAAMGEEIAALRRPTRRLRIGLVPSVRAGLLPSLLAVWARECPGVRTEIIGGDDPELITWLDAGLIDLAVLIDPTGAQVDERALELPGDVIHAALPQDHPLAAESSVTIGELSDDPLLINTVGCDVQVARVHATAGIPVPEATRIGELETIFTLVRHGAGISLVPGHMRPALPEGIALVPITPPCRRRLLLTGPPHAPWDPDVTALIEAARR